MLVASIRRRLRGLAHCPLGKTLASGRLPTGGPAMYLPSPQMGYFVPCGRCQLHRFCSHACRDAMTSAFGATMDAECGRPFLAALPPQAVLAGRLAHHLASTPKGSNLLRGLSSALRYMSTPLLAELAALSVLASACYGHPAAAREQQRGSESVDPEARETVRGEPSPRPQQRGSVGASPHRVAEGAAQVLVCMARVVNNAVWVPGGAGGGGDEEERGDMQGRVQDRHAGLALYPLCSKANHSCEPSAETFFPNAWGDGAGGTRGDGGREATVRRRVEGIPGWGPGDVMGLRTVRRVGKGEAITISYGPGRERMGSKEVRLRLAEEYGFVCSCPVCTAEQQEVSNDMFGE